MANPSCGLQESVALDAKPAEGIPIPVELWPKTPFCSSPWTECGWRRLLEFSVEECFPMVWSRVLLMGYQLAPNPWFPEASRLKRLGHRWRHLCWVLCSSELRAVREVHSHLGIDFPVESSSACLDVGYIQLPEDSGSRGPRRKNEAQGEEAGSPRAAPGFRSDLICLHIPEGASDRLLQSEHLDNAHTFCRLEPVIANIWPENMLLISQSISLITGNGQVPSVNDLLFCYNFKCCKFLNDCKTGHKNFITFFCKQSYRWWLSTFWRGY